jgi:hypothetical protein
LSPILLIFINIFDYLENDSYLFYFFTNLNFLNNFLKWFIKDKNKGRLKITKIPRQSAGEHKKGGFGGQ